MNTLVGIGRLTLIGGGNMGGAMLDGWLDGGLDGASVQLIDPGLSEARAEVWTSRGVTVRAEPEDEAPDILVVAVKPQIMDAVLAGLGSAFDEGTLVVSVAAGITLERLQAVFGADAACVRAMPNTPSQVRRGVTVCCPTDAVSETMRGRVDALMRAIGRVEWVEDEGLMDAVTAMSGSGPAYVFHMAEAMAAAGEKAGLPADLAARLALETIAGAGELMHRSDYAPEALRVAVTSPNGTTQAALDVLMAELPDLMERAVAAAARRSRELA